MNLMIFGDSYSTYEGYIPKGYGTYYCKNGREDGAPANLTKKILQYNLKNLQNLR